MMRWFIPVGIALGAAFLLNKNEDQNTVILKKEEILPERKEFDRANLPLEYSKHALCRMDCRTISEAEIEAIRKMGAVNVAKSDLKAKECPRWALEGNTKDGQEVRIIFAQCTDKMVVVTAIDTGEDHYCDCK